MRVCACAMGYGLMDDGAAGACVRSGWRCELWAAAMLLGGFGRVVVVALADMLDAVGGGVAVASACDW